MKIEKLITTTQEQDLKITGITLLSIEEYEKYKENICAVKTWYWWLRSPGYDENYTAVVRGSGLVSHYGSSVDITYGVRPALIINLESSNLQISDKFKVKGYTWTVISDTLAICDEIIGEESFRDNLRAPDANDYEASDVKKYIEEWWNE